jgi:hypothetical protein
MAAAEHLDAHELKRDDRAVQRQPGQGAGERSN